MERKIKLEKALKKLIGYKLIKLDEKQLVVSNDNKTYILDIQKDEGDCCGYNDVETSFYKKVRPIITNIEVKTPEEDDWDGEKTIITFYGINKAIAEIRSCSSSDSGWCYGACVSISCKNLKIKEIISEW